MSISSEDSQSSEVPKEPQAFLNFPDADFTIVSGDGIQLKVHKLVLSLASPLFQTMFEAAPNSDSEGGDGHTSLHMEENSVVLDTLLRFLYPRTPKRPISDISEAASVIEAAHKYELGSITANIGREIEDLLEEEYNPLRAWAIAKQCGHESARQSAMIRFLRLDEDEEGLEVLKEEARVELSWFSASDYHKLAEWRTKATEEALEVGRNLDWVKELCPKEEIAHLARISPDPNFRIAQAARDKKRERSGKQERQTFAKLLRYTLSIGNPYNSMEDIAKAFWHWGMIASLSCGCDWCNREPRFRSVEMQRLKESRSLHNVLAL